MTSAANRQHPKQPSAMAVVGRQQDPSRKDTQRFLTALALGLMLWLAGWLVLIAGQLGKAHPDNVWVEEAYALKLAAAERLRGREKVLLVGGSATMFGVDSAQLAEHLGKPVVNLGVNAGLGTYAVPELVDNVLEPGDLVVMPLEYRLLLWDGVPSYVTLSWGLAHPETLLHWSPKTLLWGLWSLPLERVLQGYKSFDRAAVKRGPYGVHNLNPWGDQTNTASTLRTDAQRQALINQPPERYDALYGESTLGLDEWHHWWQRWQARGVCLVVVPPPFLYVADYASQSFTALFDGVPDRVAARGVPYLGHPSDGFFSVEAMFDTNYHLTAESRAAFTDRLATSLRSGDLNCLAQYSRQDAH
jgi:hypothetical protein